MPPTARPHKLQATLRSAYVRLSQSRGAKLALLEPHAIPRPAASGRSRPFRCSSSPNCKRFAGLQFGSICLVRKSRQKDALRPRKLHIPRPAAGGRPRPFRCSSSPNCKRFAGLQFGSYIVRCRARTGREKESARKRHKRSPAPLFAHFFGQDRKSGSPKARLRPQRKSGSSVKPDKRADVGIRSYRVRRKSPSGGTASPPAEYAEMRCGCFPHERECEYET